MSRPPRPHYEHTTTGELSPQSGTPGGKNDRFDYFALEHSELIALAHDLLDAKAGTGGTGEADFAEMLLDASAVVAHILGRYQDLYAREAFLGTARSRRSLLLHGRRLAYTPDPGLSATGHLAFVVKEGLAGTVHAGLQLGSVPRGESPAEHYETLEDIEVDARLNVLPVARPRRAVRLRATDTSFIVHGQVELEAGGIAVLVGKKLWRAYTVVATRPAPDAPGHTVVDIAEQVGASIDLTAWSNEDTERYRLLAAPASRLHLFGWRADPAIFPPHHLRDAGPGCEPEGVSAAEDWCPGLDEELRLLAPGKKMLKKTRDTAMLAGNQEEQEPGKQTGKIGPDDFLLHGDVCAPGGTGDKEPALEDALVMEGHYLVYAGGEPANVFDCRDHYLDRDVGEPLLDTWVVKLTNRRSGTGLPTVYRITGESLRTVVFCSSWTETYEQVTAIHSSTDDDGNTTTTVETEPVETQREARISDTVTALRVRGFGVSTDAIRIGIQEPESAWLGHWRVQAPLLEEVPNDEVVDHALELAGVYPSLRPGRRLILAATDADVAQVVELTKVDATEENTTRIEWRNLSDAGGHTWRAGYMVVYGNVARVSHGRTVSKILGGSDGVQPYLEFSLEKSPVTMLPTADGAVPSLEVRVDGVAWQPVEDFANSNPHERHYQVLRNQEQKTIVRFGDGKHGAVPPAGQRHIEAVYRVGLGTTGNAEAGRIRHIKKSHPLLDSVLHLVDVAGAVEPAAPERVRAEATRYIRTFDRAVSISDHADLALTYPGVARASAAWNPSTATVEVIVADAQGGGFSADFRDQVLHPYLAARRDNATGLVVLGAEHAVIELVLRVHRDPAWRWQDVESALRRALLAGEYDDPGLFAFAGRNLGQPAFASEILARASAVPGVDYVDISQFDRAGGGGRHDVLRPPPRAWLSLAVNRLELIDVTREASS